MTGASRSARRIVTREMPPQRVAKPRHFNPYPVYKDSGVDSLGNIPEHWSVKRLKHLAVLNPDVLSEEANPTLEISYVDIGGVDSLGRITEREQMTFASAPSRARRRVRNGDVIVSTVRTYLRAIAPIIEPEPDMVVSTGFAVVRPEKDLTTSYAAYALRAPYFVERVVANSKGVSFPAINESEMATFAVAAPPVTEQHAIAAFLDRETARIDELMEKKGRLIELLQEQRTALISRAVTKGLDQNVPMKPSGVEWLGKIPASWEVKRLRHVADGLGVGVVVNPSQYVADEGLPFLYGSDVGEGFISTGECRRISAADSAGLPKSRLRAGDLVMVRVGAPGVTAVVPRELEGANCASMLVIRRSRTIDSTWLCYALNSRYVRVQVELVQYGAAQEQFNVSHAMDFLLAVPPPSDQRDIATFLDGETARIDALVTKVREAIDRLKELRTALISAAVTGKIDVRQAVA